MFCTLFIPCYPKGGVTSKQAARCCCCCCTRCCSCCTRTCCSHTCACELWGLELWAESSLPALARLGLGCPSCSGSSCSGCCRLSPLTLLHCPQQPQGPSVAVRPCLLVCAHVCSHSWLLHSFIRSNLLILLSEPHCPVRTPTENFVGSPGLTGNC